MNDVSIVHILKIADLEEEMKSNSSSEAVNNEREKLLAISDELERMNTNYTTLKEENQHLTQKVEKLEKESMSNCAEMYDCGL